MEKGLTTVEARDRVDAVLGKGHKLQFVELKEVPDDTVVFSSCGTGGGIQTLMKEKCTSFPRGRLTHQSRYKTDRVERIKDLIKQADREWCPLNTWSKLPDEGFPEEGVKRLTQLCGKEPYSHLQFEVAPGFVRELCDMAMKDKPFIDATAAGHRAAPEIAQNGMNLANVPCTPAVWTTMLGDLIVLEKTLCFQRMEELVEGISTYSGGSVRGLHAVKSSDLKKAAFGGAESLTMKVGKAIRGATKSGKEPVPSILKALGPIGYKLFEGEIFDYWQDDEYSFIWGKAKIKGTGAYAGHDMTI